MVKHFNVRFALDTFLILHTFPSEPEGCFNLFTELSGTITSPNFPRNYPSLYDCVWIIEGGNCLSRGCVGKNLLTSSFVGGQTKAKSHIRPVIVVMTKLEGIWWEV